MRYRFMRFPGGVGKAVTLSYDDGSKSDIRLAGLFDKYSLKCTFNLNGEALRSTWDDYCMTTDETKKYILASGHEIAIHGLEHRGPCTLRSVEGIREVLDCRLELESRYGIIIRGMAYPDKGISAFESGIKYEDVKAYLKELDVAYARNDDSDTDDFSLPSDWYAWRPNIHHNSKKANSIIDSFLSIDRTSKRHPDSSASPCLFYMWGHSVEFKTEAQWEYIEGLCRKISGKSDIWYATNIELHDYVKAYESLIYSAAGDMIFNPTLYEIFFDIDGILYNIKPGETIKI